MNHYPRPALAQLLATELTGSSTFSDAHNGLFLAGPRRTGKTEFLRQDLKPALEALGLLVLYVDLWEDKSRSPMDLIATQLAVALDAQLGVISKTAKQSGINKLSFPGVFSLDLSKIGQTDGMSLYQALDLLFKKSGKRIVLIVDEAQHALTTDDGDATMSALKSARDQMKSADNSRLLIVMSGSHPDKLMRLLNTAGAPFWGSQVRALPALDNDYVATLATALRQTNPELASVRQSSLEAAFEHVGRRPQFLVAHIGQALQQAHDGASFETALLTLAQQQRRAERDEFSRLYQRLEPLQRAVLQRLLETGEQFRPFDGKTLDWYGELLGTRPTPAQLQRALEALRTCDPPLVWKSTRGDYSVYDQGLSNWHAHLVGERQWPPAVHME